MHYNWQRYYDPVTGRYTQTDLIGFSAGDYNLYRYVANNSVNYFDIVGLAACKPIIDLRYLQGLFVSGKFRIYGLFGLKVEVNIGREERGIHGKSVSRGIGLYVSLGSYNLGFYVGQSAPGEPTPMKIDPITRLPVPGTGRSIPQMLKGRPINIIMGIKKGEIEGIYDDGDLYIGGEIGALIGVAASINLSEIWRRIKDNNKSISTCPYEIPKQPTRTYDCHRYH